MKQENLYENGFFEDGLPYIKIGSEPNIILNIEALSFKHEPPSGFMAKQFVKSSQAFTNKYGVYLVGRKQNIPENYSFEEMATDYANMIRREFKKPVIVMGTSTGGQIAQYLAASHPDTVLKLVIISAAYRLSEMGIKIEGTSADYFKQKKYGRALAAIMDLIYSSGLKRSILKVFIRIIGKWIIGRIKYPNDFLAEVRGDREMNFWDRLSEIKAPTLVVSGENDIGYIAKDVRNTAERIPNSKLILYPDYGHNLMMANGKEVYKEIRKFLNI